MIELEEVETVEIINSENEKISMDCILLNLNDGIFNLKKNF